MVFQTHTAECAFAVGPIRSIFGFISVFKSIHFVWTRSEMYRFLCFLWQLETIAVDVGIVSISWQLNSVVYLCFWWRTPRISAAFHLDGGWCESDFQEVTEVWPAWQFSLLVNHSQQFLKGCEAVRGRAKTVNLSLLLPSEHMLRRCTSPASSRLLPPLLHSCGENPPMKEPPLCLLDFFFNGSFIHTDVGRPGGIFSRSPCVAAQCAGTDKGCRIMWFIWIQSGPSCREWETRPFFNTPLSKCRSSHTAKGK